MTQFQTQLNSTDFKPEQVLDLYHLIGGQRPQVSSEDVQRVHENSALTVTVTLGEEQLVGYLRCLSDSVSSTWIPELLVHPEFISFGVEDLLLEAVVNQYKHTMIYYQTFYDSFSQRVNLFNKFGIKPLSNLVVCARPADLP